MTGSPGRRSPALLASLVALAACGSAEAPGAAEGVDAVPAHGGPGTPTVRDSAGIRIVENVAPVWSEETAWRLSDAPVLELGAGLGGDPDQHFFAIRGVRRLPGGTIAVADGGSYRVILFDSAGRVLARAGGPGEGPGEFPREGMQRMLRCGADSLFVWGFPGRVTVFAPSGELGRTFTPRPPPGDASIVEVTGCFGDRLVARSWSGERVTEPGAHRLTARLGLYSLDGDLVEPLGSFPTGDWTYNEVPGRGLGSHPTPFGRTLSLTAGGQRLATGIGDDFEIEMRDATGALREIVHILGRERPVTAAEVDRFREFAVEGTRDERFRRNLERELSAPERYATLPAFAEIHLDAEGNLWAREYDDLDAVAFFNREVGGATRELRPRVVPEVPRTWTVLDPGGVLLGQLRTPPGLLVHDVGDDWMLGVWRDALGVEHVRMYALHKP